MPRSSSAQWGWSRSSWDQVLDVVDGGHGRLQHPCVIVVPAGPLGEMWLTWPVMNNTMSAITVIRAIPGRVRPAAGVS